MLLEATEFEIIIIVVPSGLANRKKFASPFHF